MLGQPTDIEAQTGKVVMSGGEMYFSRSTMITHPLRLEAIFIGSTAVSRSFNQERIGQVHSVFRRVFNVLTSNNQLISVVRGDVGKGPINIVTNLPQCISMTSIGIRRNYEVLKVDDLIIVGNNVLMISTKNAKQWKPRKEFRGNLLTIKKIIDNLTIVKEVTCSYGRFGGLAQLMEYVGDEHLEKFVSKKLNSFARMALPHLSRLLKAIRAGSSQDIERSAKKLIGLGPGLTPSADDMLSGLMISLALIAENLDVNTNFVSKVNKDITSCIPGRTTLISQEFLMHAAVGEANEPILTLIEKILTAKPNEVENATKDVLATGDTSGTDIVLGILLGSQLLLDETQYLGKHF